MLLPALVLAAAGSARAAGIDAARQDRLICLAVAQRRRAWCDQAEAKPMNRPGKELEWLRDDCLTMSRKIAVSAQLIDRSSAATAACLDWVRETTRAPVSEAALRRACRALARRKARRACAELIAGMAAPPASFAAECAADAASLVGAGDCAAFKDNPQSRVVCEAAAAYRRAKTPDGRRRCSALPLCLAMGGDDSACGRSARP